LQVTSASALTGPSVGRSHLNASQLRGVVTQSMPLTAPGSLKPDEYAAVMAFLLSYDCVQPSGRTAAVSYHGLAVTAAGRTEERDVRSRKIDARHIG
jgi:hypothetical protein